MEGGAPSVALLMLLFVGTVVSSDNVEWENHGNGLLNNRSADGPPYKITTATVSRLRKRWVFPTGFDVSATPAVTEESVYFPGWNGMLYALDAQTGRLQWQFNVTAMARGAWTHGSRATPVVWEDLLLVGMLGPPIVLAINRHTGRLVWRTARLDPTPYAIITMSGTAYQGFYYVGVSSAEEAFTCCTFQGSFLKIDLADGRVVWRTLMLPPNSGYYGAAVWGSSPSIEAKKRLVMIATGNNYAVPESVELCELERQNNIQSPDTCLDPSNHHDSILALNIDDGRIVWSRNFLAYDVWTVACQISPNTPNCPAILGPDYDFGEAPMIIYFDWPVTSRQNRSLTTTCIAVAGQKSGVMWAVDCSTGSIVWSTVAGPGGNLGGLSWGSATDGKRVYTSVINNERLRFTLAPGNGVTTGGGWVAMDARTGEVIWSVAEPSRALAIGPVSVSDGVVIAPSYTSAGDIYGLDGLTGSILWHDTTGAGMYGGASISRSCVYIGNGYHFPSIPSYNGTGVHAFCLPYKY